ncbi:MAG TPA: tetratricopeptide repeat protein, partial [Burkholderiaceae bacterium]|nr:tetratricopeptide repeat protein [Burkholderiaceae bacterium]
MTQSHPPPNSAESIVGSNSDAQNAIAQYNLGNTLRAAGQIESASACFQLAVQLQPDNALFLHLLGMTQYELGHLDAALVSFKHALCIAPDNVDVYNLLGNVLRDQGHFDAALENYRRALQLNPDYLNSRSNLLFTAAYLPGQDPIALLSQARIYGDVVARRARPYTSWTNSRESERRLRVGLVSGDLRTHPVGYFIEGVLAAIASNPAAGIEFFAYYNLIGHEDALSERIKSSCVTWRSVFALSDEALSTLIHNDNIDVLIDLSGHTGLNRLAMFAWKPAPVQVSWLGYFSTTGIAAINYVIADPWVVPESGANHFSERIWRLPESRLCFTATNISVEVAALPALENGVITFGCFNNLSKMNDAVVALWANVLLAIPDSRLFLKAKQLQEFDAQQAVRARFARHGVDPDRLLLEGFTSHSTYLEAYHRVDIALDPFPYNGGTTTIEA